MCPCDFYSPRAVLLDRLTSMDGS